MAIHIIMGMMNEFRAYSWQRLRKAGPGIERRRKGEGERGGWR